MNRTTWIATLLALAAGSPLAAERDTTHSVEAPVPQQIAHRALSLDEKEDFLRSAEVTRRKRLSVGVTKSEKLTLSDGTMTHTAHFQSVDKTWKKFRTSGRTYLNFHDSYKYNIAAYRLDRLLGLNMVPVSVERRIEGKIAAVTWWVDNVQMMEKERLEAGLIPPDSVKWSEQIGAIRIFNEWVGNADANLTNILITDDWNLRIIDFTRSFHSLRKLGKLPLRIDSRLYERLGAITRGTLTQLLGDQLDKTEIRALLERRDRIVEFYSERISRLGESIVLRKPAVTTWFLAALPSKPGIS